MERLIYLEKREVYEYPKANNLFAPSCRYPEYPFEQISDESNEVYDMVRHSLYGLGLDADNYGKPEWNPLGEYIEPGNTVVIKPNLVKNYDDKAQYTCTLTHPSVVKAVLDFCVIAKAKHIIVGDAPIQSADLQQIANDYHYQELISYYQEQGISIEYFDFRNFVSKQEKNGLIIPVVEKDDEPDKCVVVHMGRHSKHYNPDEQKTYETCGYDDAEINHRHNGERHDYVIASKILEADVIINMPKPKTHRFAGLTGAQKNFVGCCSDKESLPHFTLGSPCIGGDESNKNTLHAKSISYFYRRYMQENKDEHYKKAIFYQFFYRALQKIKNRKTYIHGAWYGNDTIWRTIIDLNKIMLYADKEGEIHFDCPQRKIVTIGDMIIAGQKDGPLYPLPKPLGIIMVSRNCAIFDYVFCKMAGFDEKLIPTIHHSIRNNKLSIADWEKVILYSNQEPINGLSIEQLEFEDEIHFEPHSFWKDVLGKDR